VKDLYAPWRSGYAQSTDKTKQESTKADECIFCQSIVENRDEFHFILKRFKYSYVILNKYPYNAGHLMVIPCEHVNSQKALTRQARSEIMEVITLSIEILEKRIQAEGINIGLNLGKSAGAGIPSHLHWHILPRWNGDTNFLPALADVKVVSFDLKEIYELLKPGFDELEKRIMRLL
jgi:ATP adenylyltransferase